MDLLEYISDRARRAQLAADTNSSPDYLWQIATGRRRASPDLARSIDESTSGQVQKATLRPDLWGEPQAA
jgi:DNA-binding transcriptional regulator YdaS (Cro superfamily)